MLISANVLRHLGAQIAVGALFALIDYFGHVDWSALGPYAALAQALVATLTAIAHEAMGTAPKHP